MVYHNDDTIRYKTFTVLVYYKERNIHDIMYKHNQHMIDRFIDLAGPIDRRTLSLYVALRESV